MHTQLEFQLTTFLKEGREDGLCWNSFLYCRVKMTEMNTKYFATSQALTFLNRTMGQRVSIEVKDFLTMAT